MSTVQLTAMQQVLQAKDAQGNHPATATLAAPGALVPRQRRRGLRQTTRSRPTKPGTPRSPVGPGREEKPDTHSELDQGEPGVQRYRVLRSEAGEEVDGRRPMLVGLPRPPPALDRKSTR